MQILQHWIIMAWRQKWLKQYKDVNLLNLDANPTTLDHHGMASEMAKTIQRRKLIVVPHERSEFSLRRDLY